MTKSPSCLSLTYYLVTETPSKAFLEEQKEKLERKGIIDNDNIVLTSFFLEIKQRGWASRHPSQVRPEFRAFSSSAQTMQMTRPYSGPTAFGHSSSSTTPSPTDSSKLEVIKSMHNMLTVCSSFI